MKVPRCLFAFVGEFGLVSCVVVAVAAPVVVAAIRRLGLEKLDSQRWLLFFLFRQWAPDAEVVGALILGHSI